MAKRFHSDYKSLKARSYTIEIWDSEFSGDSTPFNTDDRGAVIRMAGEAQERHNPVVGTNCTFVFYIENATHEAIITDLLNSKEGRFTVVVKKSGSAIWRGIVLPDVSGYDEAPYPFQFELSATDGLGILKTIDYSNAGARYTGVKRLTEHIINCLNKLPHVDTFWSAGDNLLRTAVDWWELEMTPAAASDPLHLAYVDHAVFYKFEKKGLLEFTSCYDVIEGIVKAFGARIMQINGYYWIEQITIRTATSFNARYYDKTGAYLSFDTQAASFTVNQSDLSAAILSTGRYEFMPPLSKVNVEFEAFSRRNYLAGESITETTGTTTLFYSMVQNADNAIFRLTGQLNVRLKNLSYSGTTFEPLFLMFKLFIKLDTKGIKNSYVVTNFNIVYGPYSWATAGPGTYASVGMILSGGVPPSGSSNIYTFSQNIDISTPAIPNDADEIEFALLVDTIKKNDGTTLSPSLFEIKYELENAWLEIYDQGNPALSEYSMYQSVENPDDTNSKPYDIVVPIGDTDGNPNVVGRLRTFDSGTYTNTSLWGDGSNPPGNRLIQLLSRLVLEGQLTPIRKLQASVYGFAIDAIKCLFWQSKKWLMLGAELETGNDKITGEWFELVYGDPVSVSPPVKIKKLIESHSPPIYPGAPSGTTGNQGLSSSFNLSNSPPPTVLGPVAFNTLNTEIEQGDTVTSIALSIASEGDEFLAGDGVTLVNPINGQYQTFVIDVPPTSGATSLSVISATAEFSAPIGSYLVVKQKAFAFSLPGATQGQILRYNSVTNKWEPYSGAADGEVLTWDPTNGWQSEAPSGGGSLSDGDYGDVTVSGSGTAITVDDDVVTFAKMQNISTDRLVGRDTAGTGDPEQIALDPTLEFDGSGNIRRAALTGDVTAAAGSNATTIASNAVTLAKLQDISTDRLIGRDTAGTGDPEQIALNSTLEFDGAGNIRRAALTGDVTAAAGSNATAIANDAVSNAKLANMPANTIKGNNTGAGADPIDLTIAQVLTLLGALDGSGVANQLAYFIDSNTLGSDACITIDPTNDRITITGTIAGTGPNNAWLNLNSGAITGTAEALRASGTLSSDLEIVIHNARNVGGTGFATYIAKVGGANASDPRIQFIIDGVITHVIGADNSDSDKLKITPNGTQPGVPANVGITMTSDAITLCGVNLDVPKHEWDVTGFVRASKGFIGKGSTWLDTNIAFGTGAGLGGTPAFVNSITGCNNWMRLSFTTGTAGVTANGVIFTATYPNAWPNAFNTSFVTFNSGSDSASNEFLKFRLGTCNNTSFQLIAVGTLTANTAYTLYFQMGSFNT